MRAMRKWLAFMLAAGLMVSAVTVFAEEAQGEGNTTTDSSDTTGGEQTTETSSKTYEGADKPATDGTYDWWHNTSNNKWYYLNGSQWTLSASMSGSDSDSDDSKSAAEKAAIAEAEAKQAEERANQEQASRDAVRLAGAASDEGFADVGDMYRASQKSMSAGEFYNNAVVSTPGIENAVTVGQGGNLVVNGQVTNMSATISKVTNRAYVDSVRIEQEGRVLNVVEVSYPATEATINFYMPSVTAEDAIVALQYNAGTWVEVEVAEVRADHVTLNMKGNGVVAFIAK